MNRSFVTLHAGMTLASARLELVDPSVELVLIRALTADGPRWEIRPADEIRHAEHDGETPVTEVFGWGEPTTAKECATLAGVETAGARTIVLDRGEPIGVLEAGAPVPAVFADPPRELVHDGAVRRSAHGPEVDTVRFNAEAHVDAPTSVELGETFTVALSLNPPSALPTDRRVTAELAAGDTRFDLDILLFAEGFEGPADMRGRLAVDALDLASSTVSFELTPTTVPPLATHSMNAGLIDSWPAMITLLLSHQGVPAGRIDHPLDVQVPEAARNQSPDPLPVAAIATTTRSTEPAGATTPDPMTVDFPDLPPPDLTIIINADDSASTAYTARLESPHGTAPPEPFPFPLDRSAAAFAANLARSITTADNGRFTVDNVTGIGIEIRDLVPAPAFWAAVNASLAAGRAATGEAPTVLLLTSDPHIPWELADLGDRPGDDGAPPFLAAQARVGRWIIGSPGDPPLPSTIRHRVFSMTAVVGEYPEDGDVDPLDEARAEGELLKAEFDATYRSATEESIANLFDRLVDRHPQLMHFACHGRSDASGNVLVANDGREIPDYAFRDTAAGRVDRPFVFLNACRVGRASEVLNRYGGFAATFIRSGCRGFIGPLWEVDDVVARELATRFYHGLADGIGPAELLRRERARFVRPEDNTQIDPPATLAAYVYYGHPAATISGIHGRQLG